MGQVTPKAPPLRIDACAQAKCEYCGRYGPLGQCQGCGAANRPFRLIDVTAYGDREPQYLEVPEMPPNSWVRK